jgi:hypothetical protein
MIEKMKKIIKCIGQEIGTIVTSKNKKNQKQPCAEKQINEPLFAFGL